VELIYNQCSAIAACCNGLLKDQHKFSHNRQ
jgi:hypothetical protein